MHWRDRGSGGTAESLIIWAPRDGEALSGSLSSCKGPSPPLQRDRKNKTKVTRRSQKQLLFKCCTSGSGLNQNTSLCDRLPRFYICVYTVFLPPMHLTGSLENRESRGKDSADLSASGVPILSAAVVGFSAAPPQGQINPVTSCPGKQQVQPWPRRSQNHRARKVERDI